MSNELSKSRSHLTDTHNRRNSDKYKRHTRRTRRRTEVEAMRAGRYDMVDAGARTPGWYD